jgi:hypothetical protein
MFSTSKEMIASKPGSGEGTLRLQLRTCLFTSALILAPKAFGFPAPRCQKTAARRRSERRVLPLSKRKGLGWSAPRPLRDTRDLPDGHGGWGDGGYPPEGRYSNPLHA